MYIRVNFPSGRCYAAQVYDPTQPEWPPNPSRLFSALVSSAYKSGSGMSSKRRTTLEWLEALPAPKISAPPADLSQAPVSYVPPGDCKRQASKGEKAFEHPVYRLRQPRHFPSAVIIGEPVVYYGWSEEVSEDLLAIITEIAAGVTHLGTSHSMVSASAFPGRMPLSATLSPDPNGNIFLRVTASGRLKELDTVYQQSAGVRRPVPVCEHLASYRAVRDRARSIESEELDFIILRISGTMHGADTSAYLGKAVRRAVMSVLGNDCPAIIHGHNGGPHVGWLPLPDVGHPHANGRIMGVGVAIPSSVGMDTRIDVLKAIGQIRELRLPDGRIANIAPPTPGQRLPVALMSRTWTSPSRTWATVTPVVIDRPPKRLTEDGLGESLAQSLVFAGYPEPPKVRISSFSLFQGAPPAFQVPADKPRYHALVQFEEPVVGPVIAGRLRYFGVGLFRPANISESVSADDL